MDDSMAVRKKTAHKKRAVNTAPRKVKLEGFPSDAESIALRQQSAYDEKAKVKRLASGDGFYGGFSVSSAQWEHLYVVEIRSLTEALNTCSCQDHRMNGLGTCKHIERVLQYLAHRRKRRFLAAANTGNPTYDIFYDAREHPPQLRLLRPVSPVADIEKNIAPFFSSDGILLGHAADTWSSLESEIAALPSRRRAHIRVSQHCDYWLARERRMAELQHLRQVYEADVAAGKRTDNPVNLPLYPYQRQGMLHLAFHGRALLADEMGLGKTVQAIAASELLRQLDKAQRILVVSPASLKSEWEEQIAHFTGIQSAPVYGSRSDRLRIYTQAHHYTLCNYEQVRVDVDDINRLLMPDIIILDEAQRIKNWPTKTAKTIKRLSSPYAFVLTGTPLENRIEELYSLVEFIDPRVFGSLFRFQRDYMEILPTKEIQPKNLDELHRQASTVMLRRRKSDVEDSLPERTDKHFFVDMTSEQKARYGEYEYEVAKLVSIMKRRPLTKREHDWLQKSLACMRMTCDTPYILDEDCRDCPKLDELDAVLDDLFADDATKVIVFSEWVRMLELVKGLLDDRGIAYAEHTGKIPQKKRREQIKRFKGDPECRVFLSSESGGAGLNLQAANVVINLDLPWNPAKLEQRIARAWRKHQKRSVRVINLVAKDSIEEAMLGKLAYKTALADSVLDGAAFKESPRGERGRQAFAARVGELLGAEPTATAIEKPGTAQHEAQTLRDVLAKQFSDSVVGIERQAKTGASIVVARPGSSMEDLRHTTLAATEGNAVVITPETKALLLKLQDMGMLTLSSEIEAIHAPEGYTALADTPKPKRELDYASALTEWDKVQSERKAAHALNDIGLHEQAIPHAERLAQQARTSVAALYGSSPDTMPSDAAPIHTSLIDQLTDVASGLPDSPDHVQRILALANDIDTQLRSEP